MTNQVILPKLNWLEITDQLFQLKVSPAFQVDSDTLPLLQQLGYVNPLGKLSELGTKVCNMMFVLNDAETADAIHYKAVLSLPVTQAILQSLWGTANIDVTQVHNALLFVGVEQTILKKRLTQLLLLLNRHKIIVYSRKLRSVKLLSPPLLLSNTLPDHVYVDSSRPYSNDLRIREIIRAAQGKLMWLDKYFSKEAFEWLIREADATNIAEILIVSSVGSEPLDPVTIADYKRIKKELAKKGISIDWRLLPRSESHDFHDRWILDINGMCFNVPSVNSIKSGQRSEFHKSPNYSTIQSIFNDYYAAGTSVI